MKTSFKCRAKYRGIATIELVVAGDDGSRCQCCNDLHATKTIVATMIKDTFQKNWVNPFSSPVSSPSRVLVMSLLSCVSDSTKILYTVIYLRIT